MPESKHILVIRLSAMGDVAMTVPVLRAFAQAYPKVKVTVLTKKIFEPFFSDLTNIEVFEAKIRDQHKGVLGLWRLFKELRKLKVDAVADFHNVLRSKILKFFFFFYGIKFIQIDKGRREKKALVTGIKFEQLKSTHQRYADVLKKLGYRINLANPSFPERKALDFEVSDFLGKDTKKWIGIAPFAAFQGKMYPIDLMERVINGLAVTHKVILFGAGNDEMKVLEKLSKNNRGVVNIAGKFSLSQEIDVISNLDLMIAMDSANAHLAAMMGIKTLTLWGVTHPFAGFYPFNQDLNNALLADRKQFPQIPTSVYGKNHPKGYDKVMRTISPQAVVIKTEQILTNL